MSRVPRLTAAVAALVLAACGGDPPTRTAGVARLEVTPASLALKLGETRGLSVLVYDARGSTLSVPVTWASSSAAVATVSATGAVTATGSGTATITAAAGGKSAVVALTVEQPRVARVIFSAGHPDEVLSGATAVFRASAVDADGRDAVGWTPTWSVSDPALATIDQSGALRAIGAGTVGISVRFDTVTATTSLRIRGSLDLRITDLVMAQSIQDDSLSIPMIREGGPMLLNAWVVADAPIASGAWIHASCAVGSEEVWRDSLRLTGIHETFPSRAYPAAQFLVPNARLATGLACHAVADPGGLVPDSARGNNRYPATGGRTISVIDVPPLDITFVPIVLGADGGVMGNVTPNNVEQYLMTARQVLPIGIVNARVAGPYTTNTQFGSGQDAAWRAILREVEARRQLDGFPGHYYGILRPAPGVTFVQFSGFGFVTGRSAVSVQVGWFNRESAARETVAHELGHNFGRPHAPCGGPANPDAAYPYVEADIGVHGWDAYTAARGGRGEYLPPSTKDLMSYCRPVWISDYSFHKIVEGRQFLAAARAGATGAIVLVRGEASPAGIYLEAPFVLDARAGDEPSGADAVTVDLLDAGGQPIATRRVALQAADHGGAASFVGRVPVPPGAAVSSVRVRHTSAAAVRAIPLGQTSTVRLASDPDGSTWVHWDARAADDVLVRDAATGTLLTIGHGGRARVRLAPSVTRVAVTFPGGATRELRR